MLDKELLKNKIGFIQKDLKMLTQYKDYEIEEILSDYFKHTIIERILERIINDALDINQHIISEAKEQEPPNDYKETFLALAELAIYPKDFAERISKSVGLRNAIVHNYRKLDEEKFYNSINDCLNDYAKYCEYILKFIEK